MRNISRKEALAISQGILEKAEAERKPSDDWNYRVIKEYYPQSGITNYQIYEVYYSPTGVIKDWSKPLPISPAGETLGELREDLRYFMKALDRPVLVEKEINGKEALMEVK